MHYALDNKFPIETKEQVKIASDYFSSNLTKLHPTHRTVVAANIEKRAAQLGVAQEKSWITNYARMTKESAQISPSFEANLTSRIDALGNAGKLVKVAGEQVDASAMIRKIAELKDAGANGRALVSAISDLDKLAGIEVQYDTLHPDPIMTVFGDLNDAEFDRVKVAGQYSNYDIIRMACDDEVMAKVATALGEDTANKFKSNPFQCLNETRGPEGDLLLQTIGA